MMPAPAIAAPTVQQWAEVILGDTGPWSILADIGGHPSTLWAHTHDELAAIAADATGNRWVGMAKRYRQLGHGRGTAADCEHIQSLWVDIDHQGPTHAAGKQLPPDIAACWDIIGRFPLPPTSVVATGGGLQPHWALAEPLPQAEAIALLERWGAWWTDTAASMGWHVDSVWDISRVMRLPGTANHKADPPIPVTHVLWAPERRWGADDIDQWLPDDLPAQRPRLAPVAGYIGPDRPGDHFAAAHSCGEVLGRNGWTFHHRDATGDEHWTRPGKQRRHGASATVYAADGRCVIWTDQAPGLAARESLNPFRLYAKLEHAGDFASAARTLATAGYGTQAAPVDLTGLGPAPLPPGTGDGDSSDTTITIGTVVAWDAFWARDHEDEDWLCAPLVPRGRVVSITAAAGTGKSLLGLWVAAALATGRACLDQPAGPPRRVLYVDWEMTEADLRSRLEAFGYGPVDDLTRLAYVLAPFVGPLDSAEGGTVLLAAARHHGADLVVIDTLAGAVAGDENEADTYRALARHTTGPFRAAGITMVRIDHTGKDPDKGARGSSAKVADVDVAWIMTRIEGGYALRCQGNAAKNRVGWVPARVELRVDDSAGLRITLAPSSQRSYAAGTGELAGELDRLGVAPTASRRVCRQALADAGIEASDRLLGDAVRYRKHDQRQVTIAETDGQSGARHSARHSDDDDARHSARHAQSGARQTRNSRSADRATARATPAPSSSASARHTATLKGAVARANAPEPAQDGPEDPNNDNDPNNPFAGLEDI